jgi:hypothetical protein
MRSTIAAGILIGGAQLFTFAPYQATAADQQAPSGAFSAERAGFSVKVSGERIPYKVIALSALPGERLDLEIFDPDSAETYAVQAAHGQIERLTRHHWRWTAPAATGLYPVRVTTATADGVITLNVFVIVPLESVKDGVLNGYRIGSYPSVPLKGLAIYKPPRGLIEVTAENKDTPVSPHFRLEQFLCKQESDYPKYLVLKTRLLLKLELVLQRFNTAGFRCATLHVMSGYRTPFYNKAIGNVKYSRHVWGGAADIFIDESPRDGMMDDLNGDGVFDYRDAAVLYDLIDDLYGTSHYEPFVGGLARYKKTAAHGPFVHVDVRGFRARWGD